MFAFKNIYRRIIFFWVITSASKFFNLNLENQKKKLKHLFSVHQWYVYFEDLCFVTTCTAVVEMNQVIPSVLKHKCWIFIGDAHGDIAVDINQCTY